ncbi:Ig-like domain-containing protein [Candidatus Parcubacteria bacterium]|nr:Ig-like domain-containing protein [Candidatus Parcubacteria bacterium]
MKDKISIFVVSCVLLFLSMSFGNFACAGLVYDTVDFNNSFMEVSSVNVPADGKTTATIAITLKNAQGEPLTNQNATFISSRNDFGNDTSKTTYNAVTDITGRAQVQVSSSVPGISYYWVSAGSVPEAGSGSKSIDFPYVTVINFEKALIFCGDNFCDLGETSCAKDCYSFIEEREQDLSVYDLDYISGRAMPVVKDQVAFRYFIKNLGEETLRGPIRVSMFLNGKKVAEQDIASEFVLSNQEIYEGRIVSKEQFTVAGENKVTITAEISSGTYIDTNLGNDSLTEFVYVGGSGFPDLEIRNLRYYQDGEIRLGDYAGFKFDLYNNGPAPFTLGRSVSVTFRVNDKYIYTKNYSLGLLKAGEYKSLEYVSYQKIEAAGKVKFTAQVDGGWGLIRESNENNNSTDVSVNVVQEGTSVEGQALVVEKVAIAYSPYSDRILKDVYIRNYANEDYVFANTAAMEKWIAENQDIGGNFYVIGTYYNKTSIVIKPGITTIRIMMGTFTDVTQPVVPTPVLPDLATYDMTCVRYDFDGENYFSLSCRYLFRNMENTFAGPVEVKLVTGAGEFYKENFSNSGEVFYVKKYFEIKLAKNEMTAWEEFIFTFEGKSFLKSGDPVVLQVDPRNKITEKTKNNNALYREVKVPNDSYVPVNKLPDLKVSNLNCKRTLNGTGDNTTCSYTIKNVGTTAYKGSVILDFFAQNGNKINGGSLGLDLLSGNSYDNVVVFPGSNFGYIALRIDGENAVEELKESNNILVAKVIGDEVKKLPYILGGQSLDHVLLQASGSHNVYAIIDGKKQLIRDVAEFSKNGYQWSDLNVVPQETLNSYETAEMNTNLLQFIGDGKVYRIVKGKLLWIPTIEIFNRQNLYWDDVQKKSETDRSKYVVTRLIKSAGDDRIFYINSAGLKKYIINTETFNSYGNKYEDIVEVDIETLNSFETVAFFKGVYDNKVYKIVGNTKIWMKTSDVFIEAGGDWSKIAEVNATELSSYKDAGSSGQ